MSIRQSKVEPKRKRAGVIPYIVENGTVKMMFMQATKNPEAGWQIAKGGVEKDETTRVGALREASEELGLFEPNCSTVTNIGSFGGLSLFIAEVVDVDHFGDPLEAEVCAVSWLTLEEFQQGGRMSQKHIVKQAFNLISDQVSKKEK